MEKNKMSSEHYLIIGNGAAANSAADHIRKNDKNCRITLVSDEPYPFYYRHLLKDYMAGSIKEDALWVKPNSYYEEKNIRLRLAQRVIKIDFLNQTVYLDHLEKVSYSKILLCSGSRPKVPEIHHECCRYFTVMNTLNDSRYLKSLLPNIETAFIMGGDVISFQIATILLNLGKEVSFLIDEESFWPFHLNDEQKQEITSSLKSKGIKVIEKENVSRVKHNANTGYEIWTNKHKHYKSDIILAFFGLIPDIDFLKGSGLIIERGILVDEFLKTNLNNVYAAGDCAQLYNPEVKNYWVSIGWENAIKFGEVAAQNMMGDSVKAIHPAKSVFSLDKIKIFTSWWKEF